MGTDKALLRVEGVTLLARAVGALRVRFARLLVAVSSDGAPPRVEAEISRLRRDAGSELELTVVRDRRSGQIGPLAGVEASLAELRGEAGFFIAVDHAVVDLEFVAELLRRAAEPGCCGVVPRFEGELQGAYAVYHKVLLPAVSALLDQDGRRLGALALLEGVRILDVVGADAPPGVPDGAFRCRHPPGRLFANLNRPEDVLEFDAGD
jgi:molybdopterin-guanine dinucleotide biosynthesis protein A